MIKWGIVGLGNMANHFASAIKEVSNAKLVAISSQNKSKLDLFSSKYNINKELSFNDYVSLANCKEIDAIYISTLNNTHADLISIFAKNKKDILCEKPFCTNIEEGVNIKKIIKENNIKFFEAIAYLSHPQTNEILNIIENKEIGEINSIKSEFGFKVKKIDPKSRLFNKDLGGGTILDIGCYPLSFLSLFNKKNKKIKFNKKTIKKCITNVDIEATANLTLNDNINCEIKVSFEENLENLSTIQGSMGSLIIKQPWLPKKKTFLEIYSKKRYYKKFINSELTIYAEQIKNVSNEFLGANNSKIKLFDINKSLNNMGYLNEWMS
jgi:predicted dehydrogenase|tara:strand:+ start:534 stop:1505 length:972 start_codon:yes stop_codon:yes gene_type:complete